MHLETYSMFLPTYALFLGYFIMFNFPSCSRITIDPSKTPFKTGFYKLLLLFFLALFNEC